MLLLHLLPGQRTAGQAVQGVVELEWGSRRRRERRV